MPVETLHVAGLTLQGVSRGGVETCLMCPELGVMFDVGGRVPGQLKYGNILVSHGHQDHLGMLPWLLSQRRMNGLAAPRVFVPAEIEMALRRILHAWAEIEGQPLPVLLRGCGPGARIDLGRGLVAIALRSVHRVPSLAWLVERTTTRLRAEFKGTDGETLHRLRREGVETTEAHTQAVLCVSGDTRIELLLDEPQVRRAKVLVYEVTGWGGRRSVEDVRGFGHTHLDEMLEHLDRFEGEMLVLVHRSPRHARAEAEQTLARRLPAAFREKVVVFGQ